MKKIIFSFLLITGFSFQSINAAGYIALYSLEVADQNAYAEDMDELMSSDWGQAFPGTVTLAHYTFNGYDDATHVVVLNYENPEDLGKGTDSFTDPVFQSFFAKTSSVAEPVEQALNMKLISEVNEDPEKNQAYTIFRMQVKNPADYAKEYLKLTKAQVDAGNIEGSYGLRQLVAGDTRYYTHYAFTSAGSVGEAMAGAETLYSSESFEKFSVKVGDNRRVMNISILVNVKNY